jgi:hypothetical protein
VASVLLWALAELARLRDLAAEKRRYAAAVRAEYLRGRLCGFYSDKVEISSRDSIQTRSRSALGTGFADMSDEQLGAYILEQDELLRSLGVEVTLLKAIAAPKKR